VPSEKGQRIVVVDTGFILSVAATEDLVPALEIIWKARTLWSQEVRSELRYRDLNPGKGIPLGLASRALNGSVRWLPAPTELTDDQRKQAILLAEQIGGVGTKDNIGEASSAVLAIEHNGIIATEDREAAKIIWTVLGVRAVSICDVLEHLYETKIWNVAKIEEALDSMIAKGRPHVANITARQIADKSWRNFI